MSPRPGNKDRHLVDWHQLVEKKETREQHYFLFLRGTDYGGGVSEVDLPVTPPLLLLLLALPASVPVVATVWLALVADTGSSGC